MKSNDPDVSPHVRAGALDRARPRSGSQLVALWAVVVFGAIVHRRALADYVFEDAYITYRYAWNVASGLGFTFTPGERVLGTTTPLYTLVLAACKALGGDIPACSSTLFAASLGAVGLFGGLLLRRAGHPNAALFFALAVVAGCTDVFRYWGLETPFMTALVFAAIWAAVCGRDKLAGALAALAFLTRYDAALFAVILFTLLWVRRRELPLVPGLLATAIVVPWLVFAWLYFGSVMPNTLDAKVGETGFVEYLRESGAVQLQNLWEPLEHFGRAWLQSPRLWLAFDVALGAAALVACVRLLRREPLFALLPAYALALWTGYAKIGPPVTFHWYLVAPVLALFWMACAGCGELFPAGRFARTRLVATLVLVAAGSLWLPTAAAREAAKLTGGEQYRGRVAAYTTLSAWLIDNGLTDLRLLTTEPGYFAYRSRNPVIDAAGLVTQGIFFHGDAERRTDLTDLIVGYEPSLVVSNLPFRQSGYTLVQTAFPYKQLLMRAEDHAERYDVIARDYERACVADAAGAPLRHPFELDVERGDEARWQELGGELARIGRPRRLTVDGVGFDGDYAFVDAFRRGFQTPLFTIDFDRLEFRFAASHARQTVVQLVIAGRVVLEEGGSDDLDETEFRLVSWPVGSWRGRAARLRFVDTAVVPHWIAADRVRSVRDDQAEVLDDFDGEDGYGDRWEQTFGTEPAQLADIARLHGVQLLTSPRAAISAGQRGKQFLVSRPFPIEHANLSFLFFDFGNRTSLIELVVDGETVRETQGEGTQAIRPITWDLTELAGRDAVFRATDHNAHPDSWIGIDELRFFDAGER